MKKPSPKQVNMRFLLILAAGAVVGLIGACFEIKFLAMMGLILLVGDIIFRLVYYRCPHCGKYLDRSTGDYCPYCGKDVNS